MVAAAVAAERRVRFERVDHEAVAGAGGYDGGFAGAGAPGGSVGHLEMVGVSGVGVVGGREGGREIKSRGEREREVPGPRCWVGNAAVAGCLPWCVGIGGLCGGWAGVSGLGEQVGGHHGE